MPNWNALFPHLTDHGVSSLKADIKAEKLKALSAFEGRMTSMSPDELTRRVATLVAMGSVEAFGGMECGMPFMGSEWLEERRLNPVKPLTHDGVDVIVNNVHKFDSGWLMLLRGHGAWGEIERARGVYASVRAMLEAQASPHGENAVRQALLDEFPHALAVRPLFGWKDRTLVRIESPERGSLACVRREVRPEEDVDDALRAVVTGEYASKRSYAMRFEPDLPVISFVKHVELADPGVLATSDEEFTSVPDACLYDAVNREGQSLRDELRRQGYPVSDRFELDPVDARAFILTV